MKLHVPLLTGLIGLSTLLAACDQASEPTALAPVESVQVQNGDLVPNQYIVVLKDEVTSARSFMDAMAMSKQEIEPVYLYETMPAFQGFVAQLSAERVAQLRQDPRVAYVEQDRFVVLNDPSIQAGKDQGGIQIAAQQVPWGIARVNGGVSGVGLRACVLDTGVHLTHPDLTVDASKSKTFITSGKDAKDANDGNGHGTHVAGTIAAKDDANGVVGVAAGATIVAVKVLNSQGSGTNSGVIAGVNYVGSGTPNCQAANMSLGGGVSQALDDAVRNAAATGVKFALAAGNENANVSTTSPGRLNATNVITIAATDSADRIASFSNYGAGVDWAEPGVSILSTWKNGAYNTISGTSMATPHATGLLLLGGPRNDGRSSVNDAVKGSYPIGVR